MQSKRRFDPTATKSPFRRPRAKPERPQIPQIAPPPHALPNAPKRSPHASSDASFQGDSSTHRSETPPIQVAKNRPAASPATTSQPRGATYAKKRDPSVESSENETVDRHLIGGAKLPLTPNLRLEHFLLRRKESRILPVGRSAARGPAAARGSSSWRKEPRPPRRIPASRRAAARSCWPPAARGRTAETARGESRRRRCSAARGGGARDLARERGSWKTRNRRDGHCRHARAGGETTRPMWDGGRGGTEGEGSCVPLKTSAAPMEPSIS